MQTPTHKKKMGFLTKKPPHRPPQRPDVPSKNFCCGAVIPGTQNTGKKNLKVSLGNFQRPKKKYFPLLWGTVGWVGPFFSFGESGQ